MGEIIYISRLVLLPLLPRGVRSNATLTYLYCCLESDMELVGDQRSLTCFLSLATVGTPRLETWEPLHVQAPSMECLRGMFCDTTLSVCLIPFSFLGWAKLLGIVVIPA